MFSSCISYISLTIYILLWLLFLQMPHSLFIRICIFLLIALFCERLQGQSIYKHSNSITHLFADSLDGIYFLDSRADIFKFENLDTRQLTITGLDYNPVFHQREGNLLSTQDSVFKFSNGILQFVSEKKEALLF